MNRKKTAIIAGATGLTGSYLLKYLIEDPDIDEIKVIGRRKPEFSSSKIKLLFTDFSDHSALNTFVKGDLCFCCLGTTIKKAGSKENFKIIDLEIPVLLAQIAHANKVPAFGVVSSLGAKGASSNFYLATKGQMEEEIIKIPFDNTIIVRPSMLLGKRAESRFGEETGKIFMKALSFLFMGPLQKYRAIEASIVAMALLLLTKNNPTNKKIFESDELFEIVRKQEEIK